MTSKRLILHVGPHKTGTSTIQKMLFENSEPLKSLGYRFENAKMFPGGAGQVAELLSVNKFTLTEDFFTELNKKTDNLIVSAENFSKLNNSQVLHLADSIKDWNVQIVYYLRNPLTRLVSYWQELVKHGFKYTFLEYVAHQLRNPSLSRDLNPAVHLNCWGNAFGFENLNIHLYDQIDDVALHFARTYLDTLEINAKSNMRLNPSHSVEKTEVLRALSGYQKHLLTTHEHQADINRICNNLKNAGDSEGRSFKRNFILSWDTEVLNNLENYLINNFQFYEDFGDELFRMREVTFNYYANTVWFEVTSLYNQLKKIKSTLHEKYGSPKLDRRLHLL